MVKTGVATISHGTGPETQRMVQTSDPVMTLLRTAAAVFHVEPMPLDLCLGLHRWSAQRSPQPDQLAAAFQLIREPHEQLQTVELRSIIAESSLGGWALCGDTIDFLVHTIQEQRPTSVLEFGSGTSTLAFAWVMRRLYGAPSQPYLYSIDQSSEFIERTKQMLARHGLLDCVQFLHAELIPQRIGTTDTTCYDLSPERLKTFFGSARPGLVVIDGPAGDNGVRFGTVPLVRNYLVPQSLIYLDDGLRESELDTADRWQRLRYVSWKGVRWEGKGLICGTLARSVPTETVSKGSQQFAAAFPTAPAMRPDSIGSPSCLFINTYYQGFLDHHYKVHSDLASASCEVQQRSLQQACFGDSDFYSTGLRKAGWHTVDLIANCAPLQSQWAKEVGRNPAAPPIDQIIEQIRRIRPQVLYLQDLSLGTPSFFTAVRPHVDLVIGQIASPIPPQADLDGFDILISSFPHFVDRFRAEGRTAYYQPLAFAPRVLDVVGVLPREVPLTFVGGLSPAHRERLELLQKIGTSQPLHCWGYGTATLAQCGVEQARLHGDVWGLAMFSVLARSRMTVNHHIDVAQSNANNMRLFEATGCGALLITDYKDNLENLFEIGREVVAYRSIAECQDLIAYYLVHPDEGSAIAERGQARTLRDHTYDSRMIHTAEIMKRHLDRKLGNNRFPDPDLGSVSYGRTAIQPDQVTTELLQSWQSELIPQKQRALVEKELGEMYRGHAPKVFRILAEALRAHIRPHIQLLEVGCASGYYSEVLEYLTNTRLKYRGVDFSDAMIRMARAFYPGVQFDVGDGASLGFKNRSIPIVISSGVLLHVQTYAQHIVEAARVASDIVILHRTPVSRLMSTSYYKKFAYGVETYEIRFQEKELFQLCADAGLELVNALTYSEHPDRDEYETTYVYRVASTV